MKKRRGRKVGRRCAEEGGAAQYYVESEWMYSEGHVSMGQDGQATGAVCAMSQPSGRCGSEVRGGGREGAWQTVV